MTSSRPYLIRALHAWISDNGMTPHLLVDATAPGVVVPGSAIQAGKITLNIGLQAVRNLQLDDEFIEFSARFSGLAQQVRVPPGAVLAIYARENGQGMMFPAEEDAEAAAEAEEQSAGAEDQAAGAEERSGDDDKLRKGHLRVIK